MPLLGISLLNFGIFFGGNLNSSPKPQLYIANVDTPLLEIPTGSLTQTDIEKLPVAQEALSQVISNIENKGQFHFDITQGDFDQILEEFNNLIGPSATKSWYIYFEGKLLEFSLGYLVIE